MQAIFGFALLGVWLAAFAGWAMNIVALVKAPALALWTGFEIARAVGIFIAPLGAVLGYF